jgi:signal transduction histidine kinase
MAERVRSFDWAKTSIGSVDSWSESLRSAVSICLGAQFPIALYLGPDLVLLYNDAWSPIPGNKHPWALGKTAREAWPEIWDTISPLFQRVVTTGEGVYSENQLLPMERRGFVEECYFNFTFSPVRGENGRVDGVFNAVLETTRQVQDDRQLRTLRDLAAHASEAKSAEDACRSAAEILGANDADAPFTLVFLTDDGGHHLAATSGFEKSSTRGHAPTVWPLDEAAETGAAVLVDNLLERVGEMPGGHWGEPPRRALCVPLIRKGLVRPYGFLVAGVSPRRALDERYSGFFKLVGDQLATTIANARAYEEEKRRAAELAALDRAKTTFFSNVSHEFRTPLTLMLGPTEDALASGRPLEGDDLRAVHRNQLRLLKLVNTLLDFARMEAGRTQASFQPTDLTTLTIDLASTFRAAIERAGLRYRIECDALTEPFFIDRVMWEKVVFNLLSNALKFTFEGDIVVELRATAEGAELRVRDTGTGIPADELPRMFERFHRVEGARGRTHEGSGIGLALVSEIAKLHGGSVGVESDAGRGSTFSVRLKHGTDHLPDDRINASSPLASTALGANAYVEEALRWLPLGDQIEASAAEAMAPPLVHSTRGARVLLVDDNADMRNYVGRLLAQHWRVDSVANGVQALDAARRERPDLIVSDVMMPVLDGFGLLRAIRSDSILRAVPFILLSARAGDESRVEGLEAGADDYLQKPFSARELIARVAVHLQLASARAQLERAMASADLERQRLLQLISDAPVAIALLHGPEHRYEVVNLAHRHMVGRRDLVGKTVAEAFPELEPDAPNFAALDSVYRTGVPFIAEEFVSAPIDKSGTGAPEETIYRIVIAPSRDVGGEITGLIVVSVDVTTQVQARRQLEATRNEAERANRAKDEFLAMLGHELRNPLAPIMTALDLMRMQEGPSAGQSRARDVIERQAKHMTQLVDDLLDVSRITRGKIELKRERLMLADLVAKAIETASPLLEKAKHRLIADVPRHIVVDGDASRLVQVFSNLVSNAAKYTDEGGEITIAAHPQGDKVVVTVADNGRGISADILPRVFDLFVQERQNLDRSQGGLGLGLAIVKNLVALHGGSVTASSGGVGRGSKFEVALPLAVGVGSNAGEAQPENRAGTPSRNVSHTRGTVLIVDDNEDAAILLSEALTVMGYSTLLAVDAPSALAVARDNPAPLAALLDIGLPGMDGYELATHLRALPGWDRARLFALTGYGQPNDLERAKNAGFDRHFVKPIAIGHLEKALSAS